MNAFDGGEPTDAPCTSAEKNVHSRVLKEDHENRGPDKVKSWLSTNFLIFREPAPKDAGL